MLYQLLLLLTNYPKTQQLKTTYFYNFIHSVGQKSGGSLVGCCWLRVSYKAAIKESAAATVTSISRLSYSKLPYLLIGRHQILFFLKRLNIVRIVVNLQKSCNDSMIGSFVLHSVSCIVNILYYCGTFVTTNEPTLVHYY